MKRKGNINFVLVGARATGKTVYLASLYLNAKHITAQDAKTIEYLKPLSNQLLKGDYPTATAGTLNELMFNYKDENFSSSIQIDDVDGYFIETLSSKDEHTQNERNRFMLNLKLSEGIIFFFPYQEEFNETSIKEFNYEIDTIIASLKEMYSDRASLPIPAVIAVSKWDSSPDYKSENEIEKALEYIENKKFLKLAKEKIELNFSTLDIIPISSVGKNIHNIKPHNLEKPIKFFLEKTYLNWVQKIESLQDNRDELFIFLSKIHFDIKLYRDGKYDQLYRSLEDEYSKRLLSELKKIKTFDEYKKFETKNSKFFNALLSVNREKILKRGKELSTSKKVKQFGGTALTLSVIGALVVGILAWNAKRYLIKNETELFADIEIEYKTNNYEKALTDISDYLEVYSNTVNVKHKTKVVEIKSNIEKQQILSEAKSILANTTYENADRIEEIFTSFSQMGIDEPKIQKKLLQKKEDILLHDGYESLKNEVEHKNFKDAIYAVQNNWKDEFGENKKAILIKLLNKNLNRVIEQKLKSISSIYDVDEYNNLTKVLKTIDSLIHNNIIEKINYKPTINYDNKKEIERQKRIQQEYARLLKYGIGKLTLSFGAKNDENEPLGFKCGGEDEIILQINSYIYHFDNSDDCQGREIIWKNKSQLFTHGFYNVKVTEEDLAEDDHYDKGNFNLTKSDLIQLKNNKIIHKDIGSGYFIDIGGNK